MKVEVSAGTYQVGANFEAVIKAILVASLKSFERFFRISSSPDGLCSTTDLDDWMPGSRAPGLFVFAPLNSREKERGQGVGTFFRLDNATLRNFSFTQKRADRGSSL